MGASEMQVVLKANPFPKAAPNHTYAIFLDEPPPPDALKHATGVKDEQMRLGAREIYVHYAQRYGPFETENPGCKVRHRAQHEHGRETRRDGIEALIMSAWDVRVAEAMKPADRSDIPHHSHKPTHHREAGHNIEHQTKRLRLVHARAKAWRQRSCQIAQPQWLSHPARRELWGCLCSQDPDQHGLHWPMEVQ